MGKRERFIIVEGDNQVASILRQLELRCSRSIVVIVRTHHHHTLGVNGPHDCHDGIHEIVPLGRCQLAAGFVKRFHNQGIVGILHDFRHHLAVDIQQAGYFRIGVLVIDSVPVMRVQNDDHLVLYGKIDSPEHLLHPGFVHDALACIFLDMLFPTHGDAHIPESGITQGLEILGDDGFAPAATELGFVELGKASILCLENVAQIDTGAHIRNQALGKSRVNVDIHRCSAGTGPAFNGILHIRRRLAKQSPRIHRFRLCGRIVRTSQQDQNSSGKERHSHFFQIIHITSPFISSI